MDADRFAHYLEHVATNPEEDLARYVFTAASSAVLGTARLPLLPPRHFFRIASIDIGPILAELGQLTAEDWEQNSRHNMQVQSETRAIELSVREASGVRSRHNQYLRASDNVRKFPSLMKWLNEISATQGEGMLQLARIVKLLPHGQVYPHVDRGVYYMIRDRYHLVLQSTCGSRMQCEDQISIWHPGEVWWFNNHVRHQAFNDSSEERIHVIFDVLPEKNRALVPHLQRCAAILTTTVRP
jgi:hypothetical protein